MIKYFAVILCYVLLIMNPIICLTDTIEVSDIVIESYEIPIDSFLSTRNFTVIDKDDIKELSSVSLNDVLAFEGMVDMASRGPMGIQSDVNMRGGSFEQVLIVIDGIPLRDPQTAHYLMEIPLAINDIEKIEILKGGGSSFFGANAMTGVIHIITKKSDKKEYSIQMQAGENGFWDTSFNMHEVKDKFRFSLSAEHKESDGYMIDTDFLVNMLNASFGYKAEDDKEVMVFYGILDKDFGAANFYSNLFPHEEEHVRTDLAYINANFPIDDEVLLKLRMYQRKLDDHFILDRNDSSFYQNFHTNYLRGISTVLKDRSKDLKWNVGIFIEEDKIESSSLGDHTRENKGFFGAIHRKYDEKLFFELSSRLDHYEVFGSNWSASMGVSRFFDENWKGRISAARSFRIPSFTELYYISPANIGNENLDTERSVSYECGIEYAKNDLFASISTFLRKTDNSIDWVRDKTDDPWQAANSIDLDFRGFDLKIKKYFNKEHDGFSIKDCSLSYSFTEADDKSTNNISKYVFKYPVHLFQGKLDLFYPASFKHNFTLLYKLRESLPGYWIINTVISKDILINDIKSTYFLALDNMLDKEYVEVEGIKMPGIWVRAGISISY